MESNMEIGNEISQKIRSAVKTKLRELGSYVDEELPDYIMVMLANKRSKEQMTEDLVLFLGANTKVFTEWLVNIIQKIQDVTSLQENTEELNLLASEPIKSVKTESVRSREKKDANSKTSTKERCRSPHRTDAREEHQRHSSKSSEKIEKQRISTNVVKTVGLSSRDTVRKRKHSSSDEEDSRASNLHSVVKVKERKPTLPPSKQASGNLLKKAVAEAHLSVNKPLISSSLKYDPTSPPSPIVSHSYEEKQYQKELLLQQHRELQKQFLQMKQDREETEEAAGRGSDKDIEREFEEPTESTQSDEENRESKHVEVEKEQKDSEVTQVPEEPVIELHVSETETLEYSPEPTVGDTRIVAFADSQAGAEDSDEEKRKRKKKRRAVKSKKEKPASPKFIVTLDGVDSDMEDKYDVQLKKEKKKRKPKKKAELDDFEEIDTTEKTEEIKPPLEVASLEKPVIQQITFDLDPVDEEAEIGESMQDQNKQAEKCKFWPDCKNGDDCPFYHPTVMCRSFPNCRFGDSCRFIHPPCKFDGRCTNSVCSYTHKLKNKQQTSPVAAAIPGMGLGFMFPPPSVLTPPPPVTQPVPCKFYPSCTKADCTFYHPQPKACRFGANCTRPNCSFTHPAKPSSLKWVAPTLHISERSFAVSEQKVTSMPVL